MEKQILKSEDKEVMEEFRYKQELKRNLKFFSSFAVAFSFISITTGIFTNYQFMLTTGGPAGLWSWIITFAGQFVVALIFAELASIMPLSGYSYQWMKKLSTPAISWMMGWLCLCYLVLVVPAIDGGLAPIFASLVGIEATPLHISEIVIATLFIQAILNIVGVKLASWINNAAVFTESIGIIILTILFIVLAFRRNVNPSILFDTANTGSGLSYIQPFMMTILLGAFTLVGFETAANLSEETVNATKTVPKAIIGAITISGFFGLFFLIATTLCIKNLPDALASNNVLPYVIESNLGSVLGKVFFVVILISIFGCGTVSMTSGSRLIYAIARDDAFFFSKQFKKVSKKTKAPVSATLFILVFAIIATIFSGSLTLVVGVTSILPCIIYLITVVTYGLSRKKLTTNHSGFSLKKASKPVFIVAMIWLVAELLILTIPKEFHATALVTIILIGVGVTLYTLVFRKRLEKNSSNSDYAMFEREEFDPDIYVEE